MDTLLDCFHVPSLARDLQICGQVRPLECICIDHDRGQLSDFINEERKVLQEVKKEQQKLTLPRLLFSLAIAQKPMVYLGQYSPGYTLNLSQNNLY